MVWSARALGGVLAVSCIAVVVCERILASASAVEENDYIPSRAEWLAIELDQLAGPSSSFATRAQLSVPVGENVVRCAIRFLSETSADGEESEIRLIESLVESRFEQLRARRGWNVPIMIKRVPYDQEVLWD